jgi:hypothetical protein
MRLSIPVCAAVLLISTAGTAALSHGPATTSERPRVAAAATSLPDWPTYHGSLNRAGVSTTMPTPVGNPKVVKQVQLDGKVYASPIVAQGIVVVATENDSVYGLTPSGSILWHRKLGSPAPRSALPCGNIDPSGITGTPVYAATTGLVYVVVEHANPVRHAMAAINIRTGGVAWTRQLTLTGTAQNAMQQRGALNIGNHRVWITFGGRAGDCGDYKGRLIGIPYSGSGTAVVYTVPTAREAGMWTPPGPVVDSARHVYTAVGNGASGVGDPYDHSDSVLEFDGNANLISSFSPSSWPSDNDADLDLGSQAPALVDNWVFQAGKSGIAYVLRRDNLGGIGGQVSSMNLPCHSFGGTAVSRSVVYAPCTEGVTAVAIDSTGHMTKRWTHAGVTGAPVIGGGRIWALDTGSGVLHSLSPVDGASVGSVSVGAVTRFATPAIYGRTMYIGTLSGLTIVTTS